MAQPKIPFTDRLRDRGFIDQWGFAFFALVGIGLVIFAKWFGVDGHRVAIGAVGLMVVYAIVVAKAGSGRVRADQAGDNCYYLGLIYTLASLGFAIWKFDPEKTATTIIQGFGIALATTVAGLVLRVYFSQGRPDLENIEEITRLEITEATSRLKRELGQAVTQMNSFVRQVRQSLDEMSQTTREDFEGVASSSMSEVHSVVEEATRGIREVVTEATTAIRAEANDFATRSRRYANTFDGLLKKLDGHSENIDRITASHEALISVAKDSEQAAQDARTTAETLKDHSIAALATVQVLRDSGALVEQRMAQLQKVIAPIEQAVTTFQVNATQQLESLRTAPGEAVLTTAQTLLDAAASLQSQIAEVAKVHQQVTETIGNQAEAALKVTLRHNEKLDEQLRRSRQLAAEVQGTAGSATPAFSHSFEAGA